MANEFLMLAAATFPGTIKIDDPLLKDLPAVVAILSAHGTSQKYRGPSLLNVLNKLGYPTGSDLRGRARTAGFPATSEFNE